MITSTKCWLLFTDSGSTGNISISCTIINKVVLVTNNKILDVLTKIYGDYEEQLGYKHR